ncbi:WecB/TagA/CpsF family glycosyltransferase [Chitinivibrio alkaliphilus]|uniref:Glycosyl transferase, WecB/TagA/CpsF family n=1 Tax=Chitinivibrio alkaliphilus ACht1 TaxID=1313304 RepID=U7D4H8_9BACT|nr:WecB/TagA/CpsF family glycosyltransferase [Chitinivibrio alkaliphilus]ERP31409.1 glycosyl transferase, WecB/TagA/CpsF family [Chitinivibrio alkaliphilus ACht1]
MNAVQEFGLTIHTPTVAETMTAIEEAVISKDRALQHIVVNSAKIVYAQKNEELRRAINNSDIVNIDGQAVVWALRFLGHTVPERVAGCDLFQTLVGLCAQKGYRPYFLGARQEVLDAMIARFKKNYPALDIAGSRNGYFSQDEEAEIAADIAQAQPDMLFLGITSPKKEIFIDTHTVDMNIPFTMGVGGSFDIVAGKTQRAPRWMQKNGLEWLYRIYQEPRRMWKRYAVTNTLFILLVLKRKLFGGRSTHGA